LARQGALVSPAWVTALIALVTLLGALAAWGLRWSWRLATRIARFLDDFFGDPGVPGVRPARPGVMQRLAQLESGMQDIHDQVHLNSGHSMRDTVQRTEKLVDGLKAELRQIGGALAQGKQKPP
jgi:hypothetical protein